MIWLLSRDMVAKLERMDFSRRGKAYLCHLILPHRKCKELSFFSWKLVFLSLAYPVVWYLTNRWIATREWQALGVVELLFRP